MTWGRELSRGELDTTGGPSWKPLPPLLVAPVALVWDAATPAAWLVMVRVAALGCVLAGAAMLRREAGVLLAAGGAVALVFSTGLPRDALRGYSEPLTVLAALVVLWAVRGRRWGAAFGAATAGSLLRPEFWPFMALLWVLGLRVHALRWWSLAAFPLIPLAWFGLDYLGSGDAAHGGEVAQRRPPGSAALTSSPAVEVLERFAELTLVPVLVAAAIVLGAAVWRRRADLWALAVLAALVWVAEVAVLAERGFTGNPRYLAVPGAIVTVAAFAGVAALPGPARRWVAIALVVLTAVTVAPRALDSARDARAFVRLARSAGDLRALAEVPAGRATATNQDAKMQLAWDLDRPLDGVRPTARATGARCRAEPVVLRGPTDLFGRAPRVTRACRARGSVAEGDWRRIDLERRR